MNVSAEVVFGKSLKYFQQQKILVVLSVFIRK